ATIQAQVLDVLALAQRETGVAVVLITHDLGLVAQMADRVVVMYAGRVVESATTEELFGESRHPYTAALMASRPAAHRRGEQLHVIEGRPPNMADLPRGCPFEPRCASPLREDRCRSEVPALQASSDGRWSACHFREHGLPARQMEVR
ncbi:oligopeptide/dipeptide ABC transporter ATP-binding protein, partial [Pseudactinotalea sp.]|uniref:oligopeptide/dipeptide ABC transporter ATP-binding protein n=1 Tax=Pseudactinotalea sp. TaxID=1926260 RepID=UPI003B3AD5DA